MPLEDIERVEVIRGPGATMWGANAVNGVINVITRSADATQGASVSLTTGTEDRLAATARYGGTFGNGVSWRAWGKAFDRRPLARADGSRAADGWRMGRSGFRADYRPSETDAFTLQGDLHEGREDQTSAALLDSRALPRALRGARRRQRPQHGGALDAHPLAAVGEQPPGLRRPHQPARVAARPPAHDPRRRLPAPAGARRPPRPGLGRRLPPRPLAAHQQRPGLLRRHRSPRVAGQRLRRGRDPDRAGAPDADARA